MKSPSQEALERAIDVFGTQQRFADAVAAQKPRWPNGQVIKVRQGSVTKWVKRGYAPSEVCIAIEQATASEGKMVSRHELRPEVFTSEHLSASGASA